MKVKLLQRKFILLSLLVVILLLSVIGGYVLLRVSHFNSVSTALVTISGDQLKLTFKLNPTDQLMADELSQQLGVSSVWEQGITLTLNQATLNYLKSFTPQILEINFSPEGVDFRSQGIASLPPIISTSHYQLATNSGKLNLDQANKSRYQLTIQDPKVVLNYATSSGQLYLAPQLDPLFPILSKIATIEISTNGSLINGQIKLK